MRARQEATNEKAPTLARARGSVLASMLREANHRRLPPPSETAESAFTTNPTGSRHPILQEITNPGATAETLFEDPLVVDLLCNMEIMTLITKLHRTRNLRLSRIKRSVKSKGDLRHYILLFSPREHAADSTFDTGSSPQSRPIELLVSFQSDRRRNFELIKISPPAISPSSRLRPDHATNSTRREMLPSAS